MISLIFFSLVLTSHALRRDSPWTIKLTTADSDNSDYEGEVELLFVFQDGKQHAVTLPSTKYVKGQTVTVKRGLMSAGPLQMVYLRTHGVCPIGKIPLDVLRLQRVELESLNSNATYSKFVDDLAIKDICQNTKSLGTALKDFDTLNTAYCTVDGKQYADGEQFEIGCSAKCTCREGRYACIDMCPTVAWTAERKCHFVHVPGQCCDVVRCEDQQQLSKCDAPIPAELDNNVAGAKLPVRRYPWSVLLCVDNECSQVYGGVIVGSRHILTYAPDLSFFQNLRFIAGQYIAGANDTTFSNLKVANITSHPDFVNPDSPIADSGSRLQLLQLDQMLTFDKQIQPANLPFNKKQCSQLTKEGCSLMTVGWDRTDDQDSDVRQWFLHADKSNIERNACADKTNGTAHPKLIAGPKQRGDRRVCVNGLPRDDCTGPLGGAVVVSRGAVDFLVGLLDPDSILFSCNNAGTSSMLPLCKYSSWILSTTTAGNF